LTLMEIPSAGADPVSSVRKIRSESLLRPSSAVGARLEIPRPPSRLRRDGGLGYSAKGHAFAWRAEMHIQVTAPFRLQGCVNSFVGCSTGQMQCSGRPCAKRHAAFMLDQASADYDDLKWRFTRPLRASHRRSNKDRRRRTTEAPRSPTT